MVPWGAPSKTNVLSGKSLTMDGVNCVALRIPTIKDSGTYTEVSSIRGARLVPGTHRPFWMPDPTAELADTLSEQFANVGRQLVRRRQG